MKCLVLALAILGPGLASLLGNIQRVSMTEMVGNYRFPSSPVVYVDEQRRNTGLQTVLSRPNLLQNHGDEKVKLSSSNTYSHGLRVMTMSEYVHNWVDKDLATTSDTYAAANESYYMFGNNYDGVFRDMAAQYLGPPCPYCEEAGAKTLGIGGRNSGVSFHFHAEGFSEVILGRKQWFLFPAELTDLVYKFSPNMTVYQWTRQVFPRLLELRANVSESQTSIVAASGNLLKQQPPSSDYFGRDDVLSLEELQRLADGLYHCIIEPGEVLFFPNHWMHATLNLDSYNAFFSVFIDVQLMK